MIDELRTLGIVRAVTELAEDRAALMERVRRLEAANLELQREIEAMRAQGIRGRSDAEVKN